MSGKKRDHLRQVADRTGYSIDFVKQNVIGFFHAVRYVIQRLYVIHIHDLLTLKVNYETYKRKWLQKKKPPKRKNACRRKDTNRKFRSLKHQRKLIRQFLRGDSYIPHWPSFNMRVINERKDEINKKLEEYGEKPFK